MAARDAGAKEELRQVYGVFERTESDGGANLIQKLRAVDYALGELGQWCAYKVLLMGSLQTFVSGLIFLVICIAIMLGLIMLSAGCTIFSSGLTER